MSGIHPGPAEKDNVAEALDQVLDEVEAARRDLCVTRFCLQQAEALRRIDRAKASLAGLVRKDNALAFLENYHARSVGAGRKENDPS
jgi:hypothetical protein